MHQKSAVRPEGGHQRRNRIKQGSLAADTVIFIVLIFLALITIYPIIFVISNSISDPIEAASGNVWLLPVGFSTRAYEFVFSSLTMGRAFINSIAYTIGITIVNVMVTMMCGFGLSKKGLIWRKGISLYLIVPMWFSAGLIPAFINMTKLGLYNSLWAIFLPSLLSIYNIVLARTFISKLPSALMEAAMIDGASVPGIFARVVLPLSKPIIAVLSLYVALAVWNEWFSYMVYIPSKSELHPLQYFLVKTLLMGSAQSTMGLGSTMEEAMKKIELGYIIPQLKYAIVVVATVPIMCLYPFVQKYFVQGVMLGSLKE